MIHRVVEASAPNPYFDILTLLGLNTNLTRYITSMTWIHIAFLLGINLYGDCDFGHFDDKVPMQRHFDPIRTDMRLIVFRQWLKGGDWNGYQLPIRGSQEGTQTTCTRCSIFLLDLFHLSKFGCSMRPTQQRTLQWTTRCTLRTAADPCQGSNLLQHVVARAAQLDRNTFSRLRALIFTNASFGTTVTGLY